MFDPWLLRAENVMPGATPLIGFETKVLALGIEPATLACPVRVIEPPRKGSFPGFTVPILCVCAPSYNVRKRLSELLKP